MIPAAIAAGVIVAGLALHRHDAPVPDEKAAAVALLAAKLDGPGYFHAKPPAEPGPFDEGGPWISADDAHSQAERVIRERQLTGDKAEAVNRLISQLSEPHPSRIVGGERIQVVRLNLALDAAR